MDQVEPAQPGARRPGGAIFGLGVAVAVGAALSAGWAFRAPLAHGALTGYLAQRGVDNDFTIDRLDLAGASLSAVRLGAEDTPAVMIERVNLTFDLGGVSSIALIGPRLRFTASETGLSLGALDRLLSGPPRPRRPLPDWRIDIVGGEGLLDTPFGALPLSFEAQGRLRQDFTAVARLASTTQGGARGRLVGASAVFTARSTPQGTNAALDINATRIALGADTIENLLVQAALRAPNDLERADGLVTWRVGALENASIAASAVAGDARIAGALGPMGLAFADWRGAARVRAGALAISGARFTAPSAQATLAGRAGAGQGAWRVTASDSDVSGLRAPEINAAGDIRLRADNGIGLDLDGALVVAHAAQTEAGRTALTRAWPSLGGTPLGPLFQSSRAAALAALSDVSLDIPIALTFGRAGLGAAAPRAFLVRAGNGARLRVAPSRSGAPVLAFSSGAWRGSAQIALSGGGFPDATWRFDAISGEGTRPVIARGRLSIADWVTDDARLAAPALTTTLTLDGARGDLRLSGDARISGPLAGGAVGELAAPLDLSIQWGDGVRIATPERRCTPARFAQLTIPGFTFANGGFSICPEPDGFFATDARGIASGGFRIARLSLAGHAAGAPAQRTSMTSDGVLGRFSGPASQLILDVIADRPALEVRLAPGRTLDLRGARVTARTLTTAGSWSTEGRFEAGVLRDDALPAHVTEIAADWRAEPRGNDAVVHILNGRARVTDRPPADAPRDRRPAFQPLIVNRVSADIADGQVRGAGTIALGANGRVIGGFDARHDIARGVGEADVTTRDLTFDARLQPYMLSELARGAAENVRGPAIGQAHIEWTPTTLTARGRATLNNVSLASATLPVIEGVSGDVVFDDLFTIHTPPGQTLTIARLNPGIAVSNGVVRFQLLGDGRVSLEDARWPFAGGHIAVAATTLTLGADQTRLHLALRDIDVAQLLQTLNVPDLSATGHVEGDFPLLLTATTALIENGALRTVNGGGRIEYTGRAGDSAEGVAALAFGALRAFTYDDLALVLNGDLGGDVITTINFSGRNDAALNLSDVTPGNVPTLGGGDIPFRFNVRVTAPFRRLAETAASLGDATSLIERAQPAPESPIDPPPTAPR